MYDAVGIEYAFDFLFERPVGERGGPNDADVFRNGSIRTLGELLETTANCILVRANRFDFAPNESNPGGAKAKIESSVNKLKEMADLIVALCARRPQTARELAQRLHRNAKYLRDAYLSSLVREGRLQLTGAPNDPNVAYRAITNKGTGNDGRIPVRLL